MKRSPRPRNVKLSQAGRHKGEKQRDGKAAPAGNTASAATTNATTPTTTTTTATAIAAAGAPRGAAQALELASDIEYCQAIAPFW